MEELENRIVEQFEKSILEWYKGDDENLTNLAYALYKIAETEFLKLNTRGVVRPEVEGAKEGGLLGDAVGKGVCDACKPRDGFYLGTCCPECNRPFRQLK